MELTRHDESVEKSPNKETLLKNCFVRALNTVEKRQLMQHQQHQQQKKKLL
jgi:hypothetical protein